MEIIVSGQSWLDEGSIWTFLVVIALAILIWFLSWLLFPKSEPGPVNQSLAGFDGLDASIAAKLRSFGIQSDQDLVRLSPRGQQELESQLNLHNGEYAGWRREVLSRWRTTYLPVALRDVEDIYPDPELGGLYAKKPAEVDDLTKLPSVDRVAANRLNVAGIYTFEQIRLLTPEQRTNLKERFKLPGLDTVPSHGVTAHALARRSHLSNRRAAGRDGTRDESGEAKSSPPNEHDDLTRLGLDSAAQKRLNEVGIYTFKQLNSLSGARRLAVQRECDLGDVDFHDWQRCINAWSRGVDTVSERKRTYDTGWLHSVRLPEITSGVFDGQQLVAYPEQVVFRGSDPAHWGTDVGTPCDGVSRALPASAIRSDINYVRIRRVDTRGSVVIAITKGNLFAPGPADENGWNGLCESFFGGRHLGVFAKDIPNEVEIQFGHGGWGFGHRFDHNDQQEWGWAGRLLPPTTFEISVGHIGSLSGTVIFRSNDPTIWNRRVHEGLNRMAIPIDGVTHPISFLRLLRVDTGEAVIIRTDKASLLCCGDNPRLGWNGQNEHFSGGHHLGIYYRDAPQDVEICFGEGGWGFGHHYGDNRWQAYGWGGLVAGETVFEVSVLEQLPDYLRHELLD